MKLLFPTLLALVISTAGAQTTLDTVLDAAELAALERLVAVAERNDPKVLEAELMLAVGQREVTLEGRLREALSINAGTAIESDPYGQARPSYSLSVRLDVMALVGPDDRSGALERSLALARAESRFKVVQAFVRYVTARQAAEAAALALESAEAAFRVASARLEVGEVTLSDQLRAQTTVSEAAVALLRANGEVVISLEGLALAVGVSRDELLALLQEPL
jgi:hypothetical protein